MKNNIKYIRITCCMLFLFVCFLFSRKKTDAKPGDHYSPSKAAAFADSCFKDDGTGNYVKNPSPKYGEELCAGFVSQCLKEGGMSMDDTWHWYAIGNTTPAWRVCATFYSYLKDCGYSINYSPCDADVKKGDVLFYYRNNGWHHTAICVGKDENGIPIIDAYNAPHYHYNHWTLGYKTCVVSMSGYNTPSPSKKPIPQKITPKKPSITAALEYNGKKITIKSQTKQATLFYTTNGKTPSKNSLKYTEPFLLKKKTTIKAVAILNGKTSKVHSVTVDPEETVSNGIYNLIIQGTKHTKAAIVNQSQKNGEHLSACKVTDDQYYHKFHFKYIGNKNYTIKLLHSGLFLGEDISNKNGSFHFATQQNTKNPMTWKVTYTKNKYFKITSNATKYHFVSSPSEKEVYTSKTTKNCNNGWRISPTDSSKLSLREYNYPKKIKKGAAFSISGTLSSNYKILYAQILITKKKKIVLQASAKPNAKTYSLHELDNDIPFGSLTKGTYQYKVIAYDTCFHPKTILNKTFKIV